MPTLLRIFGLRFFFYLDEHQPIHVHVECNGKLAKIELEPEVTIVYNHGLKEQEMRMAVDTCKIYRVQSPEDGDIFFDGLPPHTSHFSTLATARTEVVGKLGTAVMTMLDDVLMTIDIMRFGLLPAAEAVVILYYLILISFDKSQFFLLRFP